MLLLPMLDSPRRKFIILVAGVSFWVFSVTLLRGKSCRPVTAVKTKTPKIATTTDDSWGCPEILSRQLNASNVVLSSLAVHCEIHPWLPFSEILPDLGYYERILKAIQSYPSPIVLYAGRGTTGTRTIEGWLIEKNQSVIHFAKSSCSVGSFTAKCFEEAQKGFVMHDLKKHLRKGRDHETIDDSFHDDLKMLLADGLTRVLRCGDCGTLHLTDSPFVPMFSELFFALGPRTRVVLSRRDERDWTAKRQSNHGSSISGMFCESDWETIPDPFSYQQCASCRGLMKDFGFADTAKVELAYRKYNAYVEGVVPPNYLLTINLFSSNVVNDTQGPKINRGTWTTANEALLTEFLGLRVPR